MKESDLQPKLGRLLSFIAVVSLAVALLFYWLER